MSNSSTCDFNDITNDYIAAYDYNFKKNLNKRLHDIKNKNCYIKIFNYIIQNNLTYSKNENGIFFNLSELDDKYIYIIDKILFYYENKKK